MIPPLLLALAGCQPRADRWAQGIPCDETHSVVIVGGGPAGLAVAGDAPDALLLEATDSLGGLRGWVEVFLVGTDAQLEAGFEDSPELAAEDWPTLTGSEASAATRQYLEALPSVGARFEEMGFSVELDPEPPPILPEHQRSHWFTEIDPALWVELQAQVRDTTILRTSTQVDEILVEEGAVVGVRAGDSWICADAVVLATGGYSANERLVGKVTPQAEGTWAVADDEPPADGVAVRWALQHGWGIGHLEDIGWHRRSIAILGEDSTPVMPDLGTDLPWIWVDPSGARFVDETAHHSVMLTTVYREHEPVWGIGPWDAIAALVYDGKDLARLEKARDEGVSILCDEDPATLAKARRIDPDGLAATLEEIADLQGESDAFDRRIDTFPSFEGSLCAFTPGRQADKTFGGVMVDLHGQVLDRDGNPVEGLYAVGEAAGMGSPHMGGLAGFDGSISAVVWSGWRTGAWLAQTLKPE